MVLAQGGLPKRICTMNEELNEARENIHISKDCKYPAWLVHRRRGQVREARNRQVLDDGVLKNPELLAKGRTVF